MNVPWNPKLNTLVIDCLNPVVICLLVSYPAARAAGTVAQPLASLGWTENKHMDGWLLEDSEEDPDPEGFSLFPAGHRKR